MNPKTTKALDPNVDTDKPSAGPKSFVTTITEMRRGGLVHDLTREFNELVKKCVAEEKPGVLVLKISLKPRLGGQMEVFDDITVKKPKEERGSSLMFSTVEGNLQRTDPAQPDLPGLRSVDAETGEIRRL